MLGKWGLMASSTHSSVLLIIKIHSSRHNGVKWWWARFKKKKTKLVGVSVAGTQVKVPAKRLGSKEMSWNRALVWEFVSKRVEQTCGLEERQRTWGKLLEEKGQLGENLGVRQMLAVEIKFMTPVQCCLLRCWHELWNSKHMRCNLNIIQLYVSADVKCKNCQVGNQHTSVGCALALGGYLTGLSGALTNNTSSPPFLCVTVDWMLSLSFASQVTWPGTQPSSTRFPATPHQFGPSKGLLGSLGDQVPLERLVSKDLQGPQVSPEMQVCQGPQENEVSWATPLTECHVAEHNRGAYTMIIVWNNGPEFILLQLFFSSSCTPKVEKIE